MIRYGTVAQMVAYLDREEIAAAREKRFRKNIRRLKTATQRKFALTLIRVMEHEKGSEIYIRKKVMKALKIKVKLYERYRRNCIQTMDN